MIHILALDLKDDLAMIAEYEHYHATMRPEIEETIRAAGITGNRRDLFFRAKGAARCRKPHCAGVGKPYVDLPTGTSLRSTR